MPPSSKTNTGREVVWWGGGHCVVVIKDCLGNALAMLKAHNEGL